MTDERFTVEDRGDESRFVLFDNEPAKAADAVESEEAKGAAPVEIGEITYVEVSADDGTTDRVLYHTGVSPDYAGQGLATLLVSAAVTATIAAGQKIVPVCPYIVKWLPKHPEYSASVVEASTKYLRAVQSVQR